MVIYQIRSDLRFGPRLPTYDGSPHASRCIDVAPDDPIESTTADVVLPDSLSGLNPRHRISSLLIRCYYSFQSMSVMPGLSTCSLYIAVFRFRFTVRA